MRLRSFLDGVLALPLSTWVFLAFALSYLLFFVTPIFLSTAGPALVVLLAEDAQGASAGEAWRIAWISLIFILSFAYLSTFFPYAQKPVVFANNFPALLAMLMAVTALAWLPHAPPERVDPGAIAGPQPSRGTLDG